MLLQPTWLVDTLAGVMLATSAYCAARLVAARLWGRALHQDITVAHLVDALAMAGMLVAALRILPDGIWEIVFGALTAWFAIRGVRFVRRRGIAGTDADHVHHVSHYLSHLVMAGSMLFMFVEASPATAAAGATASGTMAMGTGGTGNLGGLALLFVVILFASAVWHADSLTRYTSTRRIMVGAGAPVGASPPEGPAPAVGTPVDQSPGLAPRLEMACHIVVCITMGYMLVLML